ncbi:MAG: thioredoxin-dependent thiol peroxidase [Opitutales bacterium]
MEAPNPLSAGHKAPRFEFEEAGRTFSSEAMSRPCLLYFYPKDNTPGCTTQACAIRDDWSAFKAANLQVIGVSKDSLESHEKFRAKHALPFPLISDPEHLLAKAYGVFGKKTFMGREFEAAHRMSFLIDTDGTILKTFTKVKPATHAAEVLATINQLNT